MGIISDHKNPSLSPETLSYIDSSYRQMLAEKDGQAEPAWGDMDLEIDDELLNRHFYGVDAALATYITWDIRHTLIDHVDEDITSIGRAEVVRRDRLGEILAKSGRYERIARKLGAEALTDYDKPFSPKIVSLLVGYGFNKMLDLNSRYARNRFRWSIQVPPAWHDSEGNRV